MTTLRTGQGGSEVVRESGTVLAASLPASSLDYYRVYPEGPDEERRTDPEGILVEEFVLAEDYSATCLTSTGWSSSDRQWRHSSAFSRDLRVDEKLRSRVVGTSRPDVEVIYRRLGGGELPTEETLRSFFDDGEPLATAPVAAEHRAYMHFFACTAGDVV